MKRLYWRTFLSFSSIFFLQATSVLAETCSEAQAFNKMFALNRALSHRLAQAGATREIALKLNDESADVPPLLGEKKYDEACKKYDELAKKFQIDFKKEMDGLLTFEDLQKDDGKRGGICGQGDAHAKMMENFKKLQSKVAGGAVDEDVFSKYGEDTQKVEELMYTNPSELCKKLDEIGKKYGL